MSDLWQQDLKWADKESAQDESDPIRNLQADCRARQLKDLRYFFKQSPEGPHHLKQTTRLIFQPRMESVRHYEETLTDKSLRAIKTDTAKAIAAMEKDSAHGLSVVEEILTHTPLSQATWQRLETLAGRTDEQTPRFNDLQRRFKGYVEKTIPLPRGTNIHSTAYLPAEDCIFFIDQKQKGIGRVTMHGDMLEPICRDTLFSRAMGISSTGTIWCCHSAQSGMVETDSKGNCLREYAFDGMGIPRDSIPFALHCKDEHFVLLFEDRKTKLTHTAILPRNKCGTPAQISPGTPYWTNIFESASSPLAHSAQSTVLAQLAKALLPFSLHLCSLLVDDDHVTCFYPGGLARMERQTGNLIFNWPQRKLSPGGIRLRPEVFFARLQGGQICLIHDTKKHTIHIIRL